jgi:hypothetical protein
MEKVVEVNSQGTLHLPPEVLGHAPPHTRYLVIVQGNRITLTPEGKEPLWKYASPEERIHFLKEWVQSHTDSPSLPDEALEREHMYD